VNLEEARKLARDAHIWAAYEWKSPGFINTPEVRRAEKLASVVLELADEVERLRRVEQHAQQVVYGIDYAIDYPKPWPALANLKASLSTPREEEA
jgi:hypothetical protein